MCYSTNGGTPITLQSIMQGLAGNANLTGATPVIPPYQPVNVNALQTQATQEAAQNQASSEALQEQLFPGSTASRAAAISSLTNGLNNNYVATPVTAPALQSSPLMNAAYANAQSQLALGGALPPSVQAATTLASGEQAGQSGLLGSSLQAPVAESLGLTSYGLEQQRQQTAATLGQQQLATNTGQQALQNQVNQFNAQFGASVATQNRAQNLQAASQISSMQLPASGLNPGQLAGVTIANNQSLNAYNQQQAAAQVQQQNTNASLLSQIYQTLLGHAATLSANATGGAVTPGATAQPNSLLASSGYPTASTATSGISPALDGSTSTTTSAGSLPTPAAPSANSLYASSGIAAPTGTSPSSSPFSTSLLPTDSSGATSYSSLLNGSFGLPPSPLPYAFP